MRSLMAIAAGVSLATAAAAQLVGGGVGAQVGGAMRGTAGAAATVPDATAPVDRTLDRAGSAAADTTAATTRPAGKAVRVDAGASVRVERGTRCYYDDYYYDPVYRDGSYYCERSGPAAGAAARVRTPR